MNSYGIIRTKSVLIYGIATGYADGYLLTAILHNKFLIQTTASGLLSIGE